MSGDLTCQSNLYHGKSIYFSETTKIIKCTMVPLYLHVYFTFFLQGIIRCAKKSDIIKWQARDLENLARLFPQQSKKVPQL